MTNLAPLCLLGPRRTAHRLQRVSGKALLSALSKWGKSLYGASFGVATILSNLRREDLADEVVAVSTSIEERE
jgi:hypothetical protein